jgi:hypothetical protein
MTRQVCKIHADEDLAGEFISAEVGERFICLRSDHPTPGPYEWMQAPEPAGLPEMTGLAAELGLDAILPDVLSSFGGDWVEYGVLEHAYADAHPSDFGLLVDRYSHTAVAATRYSASAFLAGVLYWLHRSGAIELRMAPSTGRWSYNRVISWWAVTPTKDWSHRVSWDSLGLSMDYVPGNSE